MDEFQEEVAKHLKALQVETPVSPKKDDNNIFLFAAVLVCVFSISITGLLFWKKYQQQHVVSSVTSVEVTDGGYTSLDQKSSVPRTQQNPLLKVDLFPGHNSSALDELSKRVDKLSTRQWLMGLALNENSVISKSIGQKIDPYMAEKYILLDEQWKLSKTPEFLMMTDEDRKLLIDYVN